MEICINPIKSTQVCQEVESNARIYGKTRFMTRKKTTALCAQDLNYDNQIEASTF